MEIFLIACRHLRKCGKLNKTKVEDYFENYFKEMEKK